MGGGWGNTDYSRKIKTDETLRPWDMKVHVVNDQQLQELLDTIAMFINMIQNKQRVLEFSPGVNNTFVQTSAWKLQKTHTHKKRKFEHNNMS